MHHLALVNRSVISEAHTFSMKFSYTSSNGYYHLWIAAKKDQLFFHTSIDKAFIISLFQEHLSPRRQRPQHINLIAYSLTDFGMNLLMSASSSKDVEEFGQKILLAYADFLNEQSSWEILPFDTIFTYDKLADEHEALAISREIHLLHDDWRHDRYSSIGFYLDDRRGDWLQAWRLADLYNNESQWYQNFLTVDDSVHTGVLEFIET
jgi:hypothetical protein